MLRRFWLVVLAFCVVPMSAPAQVRLRLDTPQFQEAYDLTNLAETFGLYSNVPHAPFSSVLGQLREFAPRSTSTNSSLGACSGFTGGDSCTLRVTDGLGSAIAPGDYQLKNIQGGIFNGYPRPMDSIEPCGPGGLGFSLDELAALERGGGGIVAAVDAKFPKSAGADMVFYVPRNWEVFVSSAAVAEAASPGWSTRFAASPNPFLACPAFRYLETSNSDLSPVVRRLVSTSDNLTEAVFVAVALLNREPDDVTIAGTVTDLIAEASNPSQIQGVAMGVRIAFDSIAERDFPSLSRVRGPQWQGILDALEAKQKLWQGQDVGEAGGAVAEMDAWLNRPNYADMKKGLTRAGNPRYIGG